MKCINISLNELEVKPNIEDSKNMFFSIPCEKELIDLDSITPTIKCEENILNPALDPLNDSAPTVYIEEKGGCLLYALDSVDELKKELEDVSLFSLSRDTTSSETHTVQNTDEQLEIANDYVEEQLINEHGNLNTFSRKNESNINISNPQEAINHLPKDLLDESRSVTTFKIENESYCDGNSTNSHCRKIPYNLRKRKCILPKCKSLTQRKSFIYSRDTRGRFISVQHSKANTVSSPPSQTSKSYVDQEIEATKLKSKSSYKMNNDSITLKNASLLTKPKSSDLEYCGYNHLAEGQEFIDSDVCVKEEDTKLENCSPNHSVEGLEPLHMDLCKKENPEPRVSVIVHTNSPAIVELKRTKRNYNSSALKTNKNKLKNINSTNGKSKPENLKRIKSENIIVKLETKITRNKREKPLQPFQKVHSRNFAHQDKSAQLTKPALSRNKCIEMTNKYYNKFPVIRFKKNIKKESQKRQSQRNKTGSNSKSTTIELSEKAKSILLPGSVFQCSVCSYSTKRIGQITVHLRRHTGLKPFKCFFCAYASVEKSHLTRHTKTHTGDHPHKCTECSYTCIQKISLDHHRKRHH